MESEDLDLLKASVNTFVKIEATDGEVFLAKPLFVQADEFDDDLPNLIYESGKLNESGNFIVEECCYMLLDEIKRVRRLI